MDFCCGTSMIGRLAPLHTEGGAVLTDVPFLFCPTCGHTVVASDVEFDVTMFAHYCETDGVKTASVFDVIERDRVQSILDEYPSRTVGFEYPSVTAEQLDHMLDLWNFAREMGDDLWRNDIRDALVRLHKVRSAERQPQSQI